MGDSGGGLNCTDQGGDFAPNGDIVGIGVSYLFKHARMTLKLN
jgi:hypothetical protein